MKLVARPMRPDDVPACTELLNHTIALGGTTAYEETYTEAYFAEHYLEEPPVSVVVLVGDRVVGFQGAFDVGDRTLSIGSFTDRRNRVKGVGRALFEATKAEARRLGYRRIIAKITEDNAQGLGYYAAMGFTDCDLLVGSARRGGVPINQVVKEMSL